MAKPCQKGWRYSPVRVHRSAAKISNSLLALRNGVKSVNFKGWRGLRYQLSANWVTSDTQPILWNSGLCWPVSMPNLMWDKVMSKLGFYPALTRSTNVGLGMSLGSGVPWWYIVWQMLHSDLGKSIHSTSIHIARAIELRGDDEWRAYDVLECWQAQRDSVMNEEHMICSQYYLHHENAVCPHL